jgi:hypothetical protein
MSSAVAAPKAVAKAVRYTFACPSPETCSGFITTAEGHTSWKQGDLPKSGAFELPCNKCGVVASVERP